MTIHHDNSKRFNIEISKIDVHYLLSGLEGKLTDLNALERLYTKNQDCKGLVRIAQSRAKIKYLTQRIEEAEPR